MRNRTVAPPFFVIAPYLLIALAGFTFYFAYRHRRIGEHGLRRAQHRAGLYATVAFIGVRNSLVDAWIHAHLAAVPARPPPALPAPPARPSEQTPPPADWRSVLEVGSADSGQFWPVPAGLRAAAGHQPACPGRRRAWPPGDAAGAGEEPRRRLSVLRVLPALALLAGLGYGGYVGVRARLADTVPSSARPGSPRTWTSP